MAYIPGKYLPKPPKPRTEVFFDLDANEVVMYLHKIMHSFENHRRYKVSNIIIEKTRIEKIIGVPTTKYTLTVTYWTYRITKPILLSDLKGLPTTPVSRGEDKA